VRGRGGGDLHTGWVNQGNDKTLTCMKIENSCRKCSECYGRRSIRLERLACPASQQSTASVFLCVRVFVFARLCGCAVSSVGALVPLNTLCFVCMSVCGCAWLCAHMCVSFVVVCVCVCLVCACVYVCV